MSKQPQDLSSYLAGCLRRPRSSANTANRCAASYKLLNYEKCIYPLSKITNNLIEICPTLKL